MVMCSISAVRVPMAVGFARTVLMGVNSFGPLSPTLGVTEQLS